LVMTLPAPQATSFVLFCISANVGAIVEKATALARQQNTTSATPGLTATAQVADRSS
jgi:hypothetical protein